MSAEVIKFERNYLGFPHVICGDCRGNTFNVSTAYKDDIEVFHSLVCVDCGNEIFIEMRPVFGPSNRK